MQFEKWEGLGNDYLILEEDHLLGPLDRDAIALLCHRHLGVGSDGILLLCPPTGAVPGAQVRMRIFNPDGSEPEMCGNGIRQFARYVSRHGYVLGNEFTVETLAGPIRPRLLPGARVRVDMGRARFASEAIDASGLGEAGKAAGRGSAEGGMVDIPFSFAGREVRFTFVDVGNPHCVIPLTSLAGVDPARLGPVVEHHPLFPKRVNVELISPRPDGSVDMRVWERGVGETQACGTGATAVGAAAVRLGLARSPVTVHLLGGDLEIEVGEEWQVVMTGPASQVFEGRLGNELLEQLGWRAVED
ncbi:MAG: diaminopimelate epimerase [Gaiellales bacterium]|nr:diaminopimelate epimerase [Gaiellales bacterium]